MAPISYPRRVHGSRYNTLGVNWEIYEDKEFSIFLFNQHKRSPNGRWVSLPHLLLGLLKSYPDSLYRFQFR